MLWLTYGCVEGRGTSEAAGQGGVGLEKDEYNPIIYYCHPVIDFELAYRWGVITIFKYIILLIYNFILSFVKDGISNFIFSYEGNTVQKLIMLTCPIPGIWIRCLKNHSSRIPCRTHSWIPDKVDGRSPKRTANSDNNRTTNNGCLLNELHSMFRLALVCEKEHLTRLYSILRNCRN